MITELDRSNSLLWKKFFSDFSYLDKEKIESELGCNPFVYYLIYQKDDRVVGFLNYSIIYDRIEINQIEVLEEFRRNNIGSMLMEELIRIAKSNNYKNITLQVRYNNYVAIGLYQKYGFQKKAVRHGYYNGVDGILMEKEMIE